MNTPNTVNIVDDDVAIRESLGEFLTHSGYQTRQYASADEFLASLRDGRDTTAPLLVISDVRMPGRSGVGLLQALRDRAVSTGAPFAAILLSAHATVPLAVEAMREGAIHFLEKPVDPDVLLETVRSAALRLRSTSHDAMARAWLETLTPREREVLAAFVARGSNKAVANALHMSPRTVEVHRTRIFRKSGASCVTELVRLAIAAGVVEGHSNDPRA